jgi:hypothetical protein
MAYREPQLLLGEKMVLRLSDDVKALLSADDSRKVLSGVRPDGVPYTVFKDSIQVDDDGNIRYWELIETSQTNKNMTHSLWFSKKVSICVVGHDGRSFQIIGTPVKAIISGEEFEEVYLYLQETFGNGVDLSTIWVIKPETEREETFAARLRLQSAKYPLVGHIDRFLKKDS